MGHHRSRTARNICAGTSLVLWCCVWATFLKWSGRENEQSPVHPVELNNHGHAFYVSAAEAGWLVAVTVVALLLFGYAFYVDPDRTQ
jgi:hypothetical protein